MQAQMEVPKYGPWTSDTPIPWVHRRRLKKIEGEADAERVVYVLERDIHPKQQVFFDRCTSKWSIAAGGVAERG